MVAGPGTASAFVGEGNVLNGAKTDLTSAAKTIIEKPTFITENVGEAGAATGVSEATGAASVFEAATVLPVLGSVLAFGTGAAVGSEICHVIGISGCWGFESEAADPATGLEKGSWQIYKPGTSVPVCSHSPNCGTIPSYLAYSWWWFRNGSESDYQGYDEGCEGGLPKSPGGLTTHVNGFEAKCRVSLSPLVEKTINYNVPFRYSMQNRKLTYHATDEPGVSNYEPGGKPYAASSEWSKKLASQLAGHSGDSAAHVGEKMASQIAGSGISDPYATQKVPDCSGLKVASCEALLKELDLKPEVTELDWDEAVIEELDELEPEKTREEESERVITILPAPGEYVVKHTGVDIEANPDKEDMPEFVPKPDEGETGDEFKERKFGLPIWFPHVTELDDGTLDPSKGPNEAVRTHPGTGTRVDPHAAPGSQDVEIQQNPSTAPDPTPGVGSVGWTPPAIPAIDMSPLSGLSPCGVFPFGLFCWVGEALGQFNTTGVCPHFSAPVAGTESDFAVTLCGETADTIMGYLRPAILLAFIVGLGFLFARGTKAIGGSD